MKLSDREILLSWVTCAVVLLGVTYAVSKPQLDDWRDLAKRRAAKKVEIQKAGELVQQRGGWEKRLSELDRVVKPLPALAAGQTDENHLKRVMIELASSNNVHLTTKALEEKKRGGLHVLPIECPWTDANTPCPPGTAAASCSLLSSITMLSLM